MKSTFMQSKETVNRTWYVIDAKDIPLGRVASKAAVILRGKHKVTYTPHVDCGDYVIIVNADKVKLTGNKLDKKIYYNHSMYQGGLRERTAKEMRESMDIIAETIDNLPEEKLNLISKSIVWNQMPTLGNKIAPATMKEA